MTQMIHELKCWPEPFRRLQLGQKNFELRKNDRLFQAGDLLVIREWDPVTERHTNSQDLRFEVTFVMPGGQFGLDPEYAALGLRPMGEQEYLEWRVA